MTASRLKGLELADLNILHGLPFHHRDPFDRAIISQALAKEIAVVSSALSKLNIWVALEATPMAIDRSEMNNPNS